MNGSTSLLRKWLEGISFGGAPLYLVGGSVRDLIMYGVPKDLDLACRNARELALRISSEKNSAFVPMEKNPDEPCYRVVGRDQRDGYIDIAELRGRSMDEDLARRDFTINSMALEIRSDCSTGDLIDPLGGAADIERKVLRRSSLQSLSSDPLRILRGVRFSAVLGFSIESLTLDDMRRSAALLRQVSAERIVNELMLILGCSGSFPFVRLLDDLGVLEIIFPEIGPMKGCIQNGFHHKDVWEHSMLVAERCEHIFGNLTEYFGDVGDDVADNLRGGSRLQLLKLTSLLHDVGKPATRAVDPETGSIAFHRHDEEGARIIEGIAQRLRISNADRGFMVRLTAEHLRILDLASGKTRPSTVVEWVRRMGDDAVPAIILSLADVMGILGPDATEGYRRRHMDWSARNVIDFYHFLKRRIDSPDLISGDDLLALGMKPGPEIGRILSLIRTSQDAGEITSREAAMAMAESLLAKGERA